MPPSVFSHLGTVLAGTLFLVATFSSASPVESAQPTIDDALIYEIVTNARPVLLFAQLTSNRILVIIGSTKRGINIVQADMHVFEQPLSYLGHDCIHLKPSTPFLTRWPAATGSYSVRMFAVPDSTGDNLILRTSVDTDVNAIHLSTDTLETLPKLHDNSAVDVFESSWLLSSTDPAHFFYLYRYGQTKLIGLQFNKTTLDQATNIYEDKRYYICDNGQTSSGQLRIRVSNTDCQVPVEWNITAGFTNATSVVLVDKTNAVLIFDRSVLTSGQSTVVVKIPAEKFWVKWVPSKEPSHRTQMSSTEKPAGTESTEPTTAKWPVVLVVAIAVPNLLLVLCLVGMCIYCLCKPKQSSDKSVLAKLPKAVNEPRNQQNHKSAAVSRTARKGIKEKHGPSCTASNLKTKVARSSTGAKKATALSSLQAASKVGKTSKSSTAGKSTTAVSKTSKNANASTSKRSLTGSNAPSSKVAPVH